MDNGVKNITGYNHSQFDHFPKLIGSILISFIILTSCSPQPPQTIEVTRIVPQTIVVTRLVEVIVTTTPVPPTSAPIPTFTPEYTSAASLTSSHRFMVWDTQQVLDAFLGAGLEAENPRPMTSDDYGLVPMLAVEGRRFFIPSICTDCSGRILSFASKEDLVIVRDYFGQMGRFSAILFSWVFVKDNILVQINGELPEATARLYEAALNDLR